MESIIESSQSKAETVLDQWAAIVKLLPDDLEASAVRYAAFRRRRGIHSAEDLLHLVLGYCALDKSLNQVGMRARLQGIADISAPGVGAA